MRTNYASSVRQLCQNISLTLRNRDEVMNLGANNYTVSWVEEQKNMKFITGESTMPPESLQRVCKCAEWPKMSHGDQTWQMQVSFQPKSLKLSPQISGGSSQLLRLICRNKFVLRKMKKEMSLFVRFQDCTRFSFLLMPISIRPLLRGSAASGTSAEGIRLILLCPLQRFI